MWFCGKKDCRIIDSQLTEVVLHSGGDGRRILNFVAESSQVIVAGRAPPGDDASDSDEEETPWHSGHL